MADDGSADDALVIEQVDECDFTGALGGFLSDRCTVSLRFYNNGALDGTIRQRKKPQLRGLSLLSTSRKRKLPSDEHDQDDGQSVVCGYVQGRWMRRGDGRVGLFQVMKRRGHVDRQTLECRAEFRNDGSTTGTWRVPSEQKKADTIKQELKDEDETESDDCREKEEDGEDVIENVFEWTSVDGAKRGDHVDDNERIREGAVSKDPLAVYPLAPGTYHFRGFTTYYVPDTPHQPRTKQKKKQKAPPRDECFVTMELHADGTLVGKSREVVYPQSCPIRGTWEVGRLRYVLEYKVRDAVGFFKYSARVGDPSDASGGEEGVRTLKGKWRNIDDNEGTTPGYTGGRGQIELVCVYRSNTTVIKSDRSSEAAADGGVEGEARGTSQAEDTVQLIDPLLNVLTTGRYLLKGKAIDDDGYEYESQLDIELHDDGTVGGTCRELVYHQLQRLEGNWTKTTIQYKLEYAVKKEVGYYWYQGRLENGGLVVHGAWCNMELLLDSHDKEHSSDYRGEKGRFSYAVMESTRRWSRMSHSDYPKAFRDRLRYVLLCSQRAHVLPSALWIKIFAFCSHEWFRSASITVKRDVEEELSLLPDGS